MRTRDRVALAQTALACASHSIVNICAKALPDVIASRHVSRNEWIGARADLMRELTRPDVSDVVLGYGVSVPPLPVRTMYVEQLLWLDQLLLELPVRVWTVGGRPTHPSRWQRVRAPEFGPEPMNERVRRLLVRHQ